MVSFHLYLQVNKMTNQKIKNSPQKTVARKAAQVMLIIPAVFLVCILILAGVLLALSPGKPEPVLDENGNPLAGGIS